MDNQNTPEKENNLPDRTHTDNTVNSQTYWNLLNQRQTCPSCGYCPTCGQRSANRYYLGSPVYPWTATSSSIH